MYFIAVWCSSKEHPLIELSSTSLCSSVVSPHGLRSHILVTLRTSFSLWLSLLADWLIYIHTTGYVPNNAYANETGVVVLTQDDDELFGEDRNQSLVGAEIVFLMLCQPTQLHIQSMEASLPQRARGNSVRVTHTAGEFAIECEGEPIANLSSNASKCSWSSQATWACSWTCQLEPRTY